MRLWPFKRRGGAQVVTPQGARSLTEADVQRIVGEVVEVVAKKRQPQNKRRMPPNKAES